MTVPGACWVQCRQVHDAVKVATAEWLKAQSENAPPALSSAVSTRSLADTGRAVGAAAGSTAAPIAEDEPGSNWVWDMMKARFKDWRHKDADMPSGGASESDIVHRKTKSEAVRHLHLLHLGGGGGDGGTKTPRVTPKRTSRLAASSTVAGADDSASGADATTIGGGDAARSASDGDVDTIATSHSVHAAGVAVARFMERLIPAKALRHSTSPQGRSESSNPQGPTSPSQDVGLGFRDAAVMASPPAVAATVTATAPITGGNSDGSGSGSGSGRISGSDSAAGSDASRS